jgi:hypothetical protein
VEPDQVDVVPAAVFRRLEQILDIAETRLAREIISDIGEAHRHERIHDNLSLVHRVTTADLDVRPCPDPNAALDPAASDSLPKMFREHHVRVQRRRQPKVSRSFATMERAEFLEDAFMNTGFLRATTLRRTVVGLTPALSRVRLRTSAAAHCWA